MPEWSEERALVQVAACRPGRLRRPRDTELRVPQPHLPGSRRGEEAPGGVGDRLLDTGVAEPVPQPLAECPGLLCAGRG